MRTAIVGRGADQRFVSVVEDGKKPFLKWVHPIGVAEAERLAAEGLIRCGNDDCDGAKFFLRNGKTPHWVHPKGLDCPFGLSERSGGGESEVHLAMKQFLVPGAVFEKVVDGGKARIDAVVTTATGRVAVELQHSNIKSGTVRHRNEVHRSAGYEHTVWVVDVGSSTAHSDDYAYQAIFDASEREVNIVAPTYKVPKKVNPALELQRARRSQWDSTDRGIKMGGAIANVLRGCLMSDQPTTIYLAQAPEDGDGDWLLRRVIEFTFQTDSRASGRCNMRAFGRGVMTGSQMQDWSRGEGPDVARGWIPATRASLSSVMATPVPGGYFVATRTGQVAQRYLHRAGTSVTSDPCPCDFCRRRISVGISPMHEGGLIVTDPALFHPKWPSTGMIDGTGSSLFDVVLNAAKEEAVDSATAVRRATVKRHTIDGPAVDHAFEEMLGGLRTATGSILAVHVEGRWCHVGYQVGQEQHLHARFVQDAYAIAEGEYKRMRAIASRLNLDVRGGGDRSQPLYFVREATSPQTKARVARKDGLD